MQEKLLLRRKAAALKLGFVTEHKPDRIVDPRKTGSIRDAGLTGPEFIMRFNEYNGAQINISGAPGYSSGQVRAALEEAFHQTMPPGMGFSYQGMSFQEQCAAEGVPAWMVFGLSLLFVFLILAALYESWTLPFSVLLSTPVAILGAYLALSMRSVRPSCRSAARWFHAP